MIQFIDNLKQSYRAWVVHRKIFKDRIPELVSMKKQLLRFYEDIYYNEYLTNSQKDELWLKVYSTAFHYKKVKNLCNDSVRIYCNQTIRIYKLDAYNKNRSQNRV